MPELVTGTHDVDVEHIVLHGPDGAAVDAIHARPDGMPLAGLVLHPDIGGIRPLFDDPIGHLLIVVGITLQTLGYFVIRKIIQIQV